MPVSEFDLVKAGLKDFKMDDLNISRHAKKRCRERGIPLEDLRRQRGEYGTAIIRGHTVVTAIPNTFEQFSEFVPIKDNGEIVNLSPIVKKYKDTLFKATIICIKEMIPRMIGKHHSYVNKLQSYIEGNIYSPSKRENVFKIITKNLDDAIFMWKLIQTQWKATPTGKVTPSNKVSSVFLSML